MLAPAKKIGVFLLSLVFLGALFLQPLSAVKAQTPTLVPIPTGTWFNQNPQEFSQKVAGGNPNDIFGERYTFAQVNWIINSLYLALNPSAGGTQDDIINNIIRQIIQQGTSASDGRIDTAPFAQLGIPGLLAGSMVDIFSHPPASGIDSINEGLAKFDLATPAHAQGYGYTSLAGLQYLWGASRNMVFLLMVILLVAAGFMIMFRVKINPQTAVTLQLMIPKLIITLVAVAFSYSIAGLVIDFTYVLVALFIAMLQLNGVITGVDPNLLGFLTGSGSGLVGSVRYFTGGYFGIVAHFTAIVLLTLISGIGNLLLPFTFLSGVVQAILGIIMIVVFIWLLFKIWWMMMKTYVQMLFLIIIGPWQIMLGLLPGQQGFGAWFRNLIANASVFVTVPIMFIMFIIFWSWSDVSDGWLGSIGSWMSSLAFPFAEPLGSITAGPSNSPFPNMPLLAAKGSLFKFMLGYATLAIIPKTAEMIRDALKIPAFRYGSAFGEALGPATGLGKFGGSVGMTRYGPRISELLGGTETVQGRAFSAINDWGQRRKLWS